MNARNLGRGLAWVSVLVLAAQAWAAPTVVTTLSIDKGSLVVGETAKLTVFGSVTSPAAADDGIFTFDLNLVLSNPTALSVVPGSVIRPGVDDLLWGGSNGTAKSWGLEGVAGGYTETDLGIATPKVLFTVDLKANVSGGSTITVGPGVTVMGTDFVLNQTTSPSTDYSAATMVVNTPEPATALLAIMGLALGLKRRR